MNKRIFKYTFLVLSIMCCLLISVFSILQAYSFMSYDVNNSPSTTKSTTLEAENTQFTNTDNSTAITNSSDANLPATDSSDISKSNTNSSKSSYEATSVDNAAIPSQKKQEHAPSKSITISAVGDLMAHKSNLNSAYNTKTGTYDFSGFLEYVAPYLQKSDLTIGNFETVTAGASSDYTSFPRFNTPDSILTALSNVGFDVLSTANNHCLDRGINGLTRTIKKIKENKMTNIGSSIDGKNKYTIKEINGIKVSILSYSYAFNGNDASLKTKQKNTYLSPINETQIKTDIKSVKTQGTDVVIVVIHWGTEYQRNPNTAQTSLSKKMFSWGADIILGSHPHVIQKSEIVKVNGKNKFIIYSMGNFISGYRRGDKAKRPNKIYTEDGVIIQLKIEKYPNGETLLKNVDYIPTWVDKNYVNNRPVFKILPIPDAIFNEPYITNRNKDFVKQSYKNTMNIMAKLK